MIEKKNYFSLFSMKVLVGFCLTWSYCGGFYQIHQTPLAAGSATKPANDSTGARNPELNYLSARIYFKGEKALSNPLFRENRDSKLSHLYIYAVFNHPALGGQKEIPLYLIDIEKGNLEVTDGMELISKLPLLPNQRGNQPLLSLKSVALEKSKLDIFRAIWSKAKPLIQTVSIATGAGAGAGIAFDSLSSLLEDLAAAKEFRYQKNLITPASFEEGITQKVEMYLIAPTDKNGVLQTEQITKLQKKDLVLKRDSGTDFPMVFDGNQEYTDLPYLLVDYRLSDFVELENGIPQKLDGTCALLTEQKVKNAETALQQATLSASQMAFETRLLERAKAYIRLKSAILQWQAEGANQEEVQRKRREAVDAYVDYQQFFVNQPVPREKIYVSYFQDRSLSLDQCTELWAQKLPGYLTLQRVSQQLTLLLTRIQKLESEQAMESVLQELRPILSLDQALAKLPGVGEGMIRGSALYNRAAAAIANVEEVEFSKYYQASTAELKTLSLSEEGERLRSRMMAKLPLLQCELCKDKIAESVRLYQAQKKVKSNVTLENEQISALYELGKWNNRLVADIRTKEWVGGYLKMGKDFRQEVSAFQRKLIHLAQAQEKGEIQDALKEVHDHLLELNHKISP